MKNRTWFFLASLLAAVTAGPWAAAQPFVIETRFLGQPLSAAQKATVVAATDRVSRLITSPYLPVNVDLPANSCDQGIPRLKERFTHLVIFVTVKNLDEDLYGESGPCELHEDNYLPIYASIFLNAQVTGDLPGVDLLDTMVHETLHALGVGTLWEADARVSLEGNTDEKNFIRKKGGMYYYTGPRAVAAYRKLGGKEQGIPLDPDRGHWAGDTVCSEIVSGSAGDYLGRVNPISALTLGALEDLGYTVNPKAADPFRLPTKQCPEGD
ncbi:hypothetical protein [Deinococcus hopiensis]|uniref:hypothetical protein n=1 Tax=Deinococcus hopiensis TaxID=309885 RepID=UPI000A05B3A7|nr:hypothetical protein [Deinococcus hopiensis]